MTTIVTLIIWTIIGTIILYYLWENTDFDSYTLPAKFFACIVGGPLFWAAFLLGVLLGIVRIIIYVLNGGEQ